MTIKFEVAMADKTGKLIPHGVMERLSVLVENGWAAFHFKDVKTTKRFYFLQKELENLGLDKTKTAYNERLQKYVTLYPDMTEEQISKKLKGEFEKLGGKIR